MMQTSLSVTEMVRGFSDYINRVVYRRETFILLKGRKPVAEIRPVARGVKLGELESLLRSLPSLTPEEAEAFAADLEVARRETPSGNLNDPWASQSTPAF